MTGRRRAFDARRLLTFAAAIWMAVAGLALTPESPVGVVPVVAAEVARPTGYWTGDRIRAATPREIVLEEPLGTRSPGGRGPDPVPEAAPGDVGGAPWTGGGAILQRSGLILFTLNGTDYSCSGSIVSDAGDPDYSLVMTAAHCAYDETTDEFASAWTFIPAWDLTPDASGCSQTTYGCWEALTLVVHAGWADEEGLTVAAVQHDYAIAVVGPELDSAAQLDALGAYPLRIDGVSEGHRLHAFGYPAASPYQGDDLIHCLASIGVQPVAGSWGLACDMTSGASGGPWLYGASDPASTAGEVASVSSYRILNDPNLYGPVLDGATRKVYEVAKAATPSVGSPGIIATGTASPTTPFTDIASSTFQADIEWLYLAGITNGCAPTLYCPKAAVTREQMAAFLVRALTLPSSATDVFTDDETSTFEAEINALRAAGITNGCAPTLYCPTASRHPRTDGGVPRAWPDPAVERHGRLHRRRDVQLRGRDQRPAGRRHHERLRADPVLPDRERDPRTDGGVPASVRR